MKKSVKGTKLFGKRPRFQLHIYFPLIKLHTLLIKNCNVSTLCISDYYTENILCDFYNQPNFPQLPSPPTKKLSTKIFNINKTLIGSIAHILKN